MKTNTWINTEVLAGVFEQRGGKGHDTAAFAHSDCSNRLLTPPPLRVIGVSKASEWAKAAVRDRLGICGGGAGLGRGV